MRFVYSLIILALGLSQFMAMGRVVLQKPTNSRVEFRADRSQNWLAESKVTQGHPAHKYLSRMDSVKTALKDTPACRNESTQCQLFGDRVAGVFNVFVGANSSHGESHIAGVIAGKAAEIVTEWEAPAQEGSGVFLDGFVRTTKPKASLHFRTGKGVESLLMHLGGGYENLSPQGQIDARTQKTIELEHNCV